MSWRIEQADPLTLLEELPAAWAQTCFTSPPRDLPVTYVLAVLEEVHRVLRADGTLWLALPKDANTHRLWDALLDTRWLRPLPAHMTPRRVLLLAKQPEFLFKPKRPVPAVTTLRSAACPRYPLACRPGHACRACRMARRAWCVPSPAGTTGIPPREIIDWCIAASTVPRACQVCGAPGRPSVRCGQRWRPACAHKGLRGCCLVIDPFCASADTGVVAVSRGRHYLGITLSRTNAEVARTRLAKLLERTR